MKNFKIAMILVAAVAFFCSCGDPEAPTVTLTGDFPTFDLAKTNDTTIKLTLKADAPKGIDAIKGTVSYLNDKDSVMKQETFDVPVTAGEKTYEGTLDCVLKKELIKDYAKIEYSVVATTKKDVTSDPAVYTITIAKPKFAEGKFTWERFGSDATGMADFGLAWTKNGTKDDMFAKIVPLTGAKLYVLASKDYNANSIEDLNLSGDGVNEFKRVSVYNSKDYDEVIATVYNKKTYLMHITHAECKEITTKTNKTTITGDYKAFDAVPQTSK